MIIRLQKILKINKMTAIDTRAMVFSIDDPFFEHIPTVEEINVLFNREGIALAVAACRKAIAEWGGPIQDITHTVAVTCTDFQTPGYDFYVTQELGLANTTDRTLLAGVGCAGGLSAMRTAANIALGASARGRAARILVFALELTSLSLRCALEDVATNSKSMNITPALFGDGAAAFMLCNEMAAEANSKAIYSLVDWICEVIPNSAPDMTLNVCSTGRLSAVSACALS
jgi:type III polyketide synthase